MFSNYETKKAYELCLEEAEIFNDILDVWTGLGVMYSLTVQTLLEDHPWFFFNLEDDIDWLQLSEALAQHLREGGF